MSALRAMPRSRAISGLSLIELMISLVLGLLLTGAAITLFNTNKLTYETTESFGRIQETSRTAFELMSRDLREAGGIPCDSDLGITNSLATPTANWWHNWNNGLLGYGPTTAFPDVAFGTGFESRVTGTDAIELKYGEVPSKNGVAPTNVFVTANITDANLGNPIAVSTVTPLANNDLLIACDYSGATIFKLTSLTGTTPGTILHATGGTIPNAAATLLLGPHGNGKDGNPLPGLALNGTIAKLRASRWYIGCNNRVPCGEIGGRSLFQSVLRNTAGTLAPVNDEIAEGVTDMNVQYLPAGASNYVDAATVTNWTNVAAVKVTLTIAGQSRAGTDGGAISRDIDHVITLRNNLP